ncbi:MAG: hypothetical protein ACTTGJ_00685 [Clostridium sp.]
MIQNKLTFKTILQQFLEAYIFDLEAHKKLPERNNVLKYFKGYNQQAKFIAFTDYILKLEEIEFLKILLEELEIASAIAKAELIILKEELAKYDLNSIVISDYNEYLEEYLTIEKRIEEGEIKSYILKCKVDYISELLESDSIKQ